jgi:hypothetical protein
MIPLPSCAGLTRASMMACRADGPYERPGGLLCVTDCRVKPGNDDGVGS